MYNRKGYYRPALTYGLCWGVKRYLESGNGNKMKCNVFEIIYLYLSNIYFSEWGSITTKSCFVCQSLICLFYGFCSKNTKLKKTFEYIQQKL